MATCPACGKRYAETQRLCPDDGTVLDPDQTRETTVVGRVLDGKYRLEAFLSRGGMGAVYQATHVMLNRKIAVKLISPHLVESADMVRRFQREARAATHLNHPNIVRVHDLGQTEDGTLYIAMDLIAGQSLSDVIKSGEPLDERRIAEITTQIVSALAHAHEHGVIHRDLKPQNIMISRRSDGREVATLLDFGIAKTFEVDAHTKVTATGFAVGSPPYMSPEQAGGAPVDARSDVYSFGVILYEMLAGEVPFNDPSTPAVLVKHLTETPVRPSIKRPDRYVPAGLEQIAMRCLEKKPEARFQSADELLRALAAPTAHAGATYAATKVSTPQPTPPLRQPTRPATPVPAAAPPGESKWRRYVAAAAVVALVAVGARALLNRPRGTDAAPETRATEPQQPAPPASPPAQIVAPQPVERKLPPPATQRKADDAPLPQPKVDDAPPPQNVTAAQTNLSRALTTRVRRLLAERRVGQGRFREATLEMTMRPTRPGRGITADYVVTVYTVSGQRTFSGSQQGQAPLPLRNAIIEKLAAEIAARLAAAP